MDEQRQKPVKPDCDPNAKSEATSVEPAGIETSTAKSNETVSSRGLMEDVLEEENLRTAIAKVQRNGGKPGVDGVTVDDLNPYMAANWIRLKQDLLSGTYKPKPVRRVEIPKPTGGMRFLGIPTVIDRVIQQAMLQVLQPLWEPTFSERSYGFRPQRSQHQAVRAAQKAIQDGHEYVVDLDLEKFFDRVNHDMLMARIAKRVGDKRVLKVLRAFLNAGILENGLVQPSIEGVPQGGPLSPFLSNVLLDDLDKELESRKLEFVRYADDCNIYVKSERAGLRVRESITRFLATKLRLKVNEEKSAVGKPSARTFLGFTFGNDARNAPILIATTALQRAKVSLRAKIRQGSRKPMEAVANDIGRYLKGWINYFGLTERITDVKSIFAYARRRLRWLAWRNWKTPEARRHNLVQRGIPFDRAYAVSHSAKGAWRNSRTPLLQQALNNAYFRALGFPCTLNGHLL